jgi:hypothetical protein
MPHTLLVIRISLVAMVMVVVTAAGVVNLGTGLLQRVLVVGWVW